VKSAKKSKRFFSKKAKDEAFFGLFYDKTAIPRIIVMDNAVKCNVRFLIFTLTFFTFWSGDHESGKQKTGGSRCSFLKCFG